jgi:hypothetical protein
VFERRARRTVSDTGDRVKKLIMIVVLLAACHSAPPGASPSPAIRGNQTGAPDPISAVNLFFDAVKKQDLQQLGAVWGGPDGPARELMAQDELYKREFVLICYTKNDHYEILGDAPSPTGGRDIAVNISYKKISRATTANVVQGPGGRWYVKTMDIGKLGEVCQQK